MRTMHGANKAERLAARAAMIPTGARLVAGPTGGAVYAYDVVDRTGATVHYVIAFRGFAARPEMHYRYRSVEARATAIATFHESLAARAARKAAAAAAKTAWTNPLVAGTVLYTSWGYDQTNVDFYAVTRVSGRRVWIRPVAADYVESGYLSGRTSAALPVRYTGPETMHTAQPLGTECGVYIKVGHQHAYVDTPGQTHYSSHYA